jgi:hypothetical protein
MIEAERERERERSAPPLDFGSTRGVQRRRNRQREEKVVLALFPPHVSPLHRHLQTGVVARGKHLGGFHCGQVFVFFKEFLFLAKSGDRLQRTMSKEKVAIIRRKN